MKTFAPRRPATAWLSRCFAIAALAAAAAVPAGAQDLQRVEIDTVVADDIDRSLIREQVEMGVAVRMACLDVLTRVHGRQAE